jgi:hypothetical protein
VGVPTAPVAAGDDIGAAEVSRRWTSSWMPLPTPVMTPLL